jgi:hypothetical protein
VDVIQEDLVSNTNLKTGYYKALGGFLSPSMKIQR